MTNLTMLETRPTPTDGRILLPSLDGVRGLAFLLVLFAHFSNHYSGPLRGVGKVGVWLFFVLSAFLLTKYFLSEPSKVESAREWGNYALRRFCRIIPMYLAAIFLYFSFDYVVNSENLAMHLFFLGAKGHFWTILVELKYYFMLPVVVFVFSRLLNLTPWRLFALLVAAWLCLYLSVPPWESLSSDTGAFTYLIIFFSGSIAALVYCRGLDGQGRKADVIWDLAGMASLVIIAITIPSVWSMLFYSVESDYFYKKYELFAVVGAVLVISVSRSGSILGRLFTNSAFKYLGAISFSGYLIHPLILRNTSYLKADIGLVPSVLLSSILVIAASSFLYFFIERRFMGIRLPKTGPVLSTASSR